MESPENIHETEQGVLVRKILRKTPEAPAEILERMLEEEQGELVRRIINDLEFCTHPPESRGHYKPSHLLFHYGLVETVYLEDLDRISWPHAVITAKGREFLEKIKETDYYKKYVRESKKSD